MDGIKVGDVVQLKSGGPMMTVSKVEAYNGVISAWYDWFVENKPQNEMFPVTSLKASEQ